MAWLERINEREARRLGRTLRNSAVAAGEHAQHDVQHAAMRTGEVAGRAADAAGSAALQVMDYARHELPVVAHAAQLQARRAGRAFQADPVPMIAGAVAIALLGSLLFGRRRATRS